MKKKEPPPLVLIEWEDPWSHAGWIDSDEALRMAAVNGKGKCRTAGFVIFENKDYVLLADSVGLTGGGQEQVGDIFKIPHRCIDKVMFLDPS